jgi:uncharacterized protein YycO
MSDLAQIGLVRTTGFMSWLIRAVTHSPVNHVIVRVSPNSVISPEGSGVQIAPVTAFPQAIWSKFPLSRGQENKIIAYALAQQGKPYNYVDDLFIGIALLTRWATPRWMQHELSDTKRWQCAQLADAAYQTAGIHLFHDERPSGAIYPGSFVPLFEDNGWM